MMVIDSLFFSRPAWSVGLMGLAVIATLSNGRADQITKTDGTVISCAILGISGEQVSVEIPSSTGGTAKNIIYRSDIKSVSMDAPGDLATVQAAGTPPATVISTLEPLVKKFAGLPANWVVQAMSELGGAYATAGQVDKAIAVYDQINKAYPGSKYVYVAQAGKAKMSLKTGKIDEALAAVQPIVDQANKDIAPSPADGELYANAFLVYGQVLEAQKKPQQALEAYLTVKTMFYQNSALVDQAEKLAQSLRDHHPGIGIE